MLLSHPMNLFPKNSSMTPADETFSSSSLVLYEHQGTPLLGIIKEYKKNKYLLLNEREREAEVQANRLHLLPGSLPSGAVTDSEKAKALVEIRSKAETALKEMDLEELWTFTVDDSREFTSKELVEVYFGENKLTEHLALRLLLLSDKVFFKRKKEFFLPRPEEIVEELKKAAAARLAKIALQEKTIEAFKNRLADPDYTFPAEIAPQLTLLEDLAAGARQFDPSRQKEAKELLKLCIEKLGINISNSKDSQAYHILRKLGRFDKFTNLSLIRHKPVLRYSEAALEEAKNLFPPARIEDCKDRESRVDLTDLECFTVDDFTTKDMDDAISVETLADGYRFGIHISDVASLIPAESLLEKEAVHHSSSFYFADQTINMLPDCLAQNSCSLLEEQVRPVLSCLVETDKNFQVRSSKVTPALIKVFKRYAYEEVDQLLIDQNPHLNLLYQLGSHCEIERISLGAKKIFNKDILVKINPNGRLSLIEIDEGSAARNMIGELMILANQIFANFCVDNLIPVLYRCQEASPPQYSDQELLNIPAGPAREYASKMGLRPTFMSLFPAPHAALGLDAYIQATSPIRRYGDLCNQRQILSFFRSREPLYSRDTLEEIQKIMAGPQQTVNAVYKETKRFWFLKYLEQRSKQNPVIKGTVLRTDLKNPLVELEEVGMPVVVKLSGKTKPGDVLNLKITRINPAQDDLKLERI